MVVEDDARRIVGQLDHRDPCPHGLDREHEAAAEDLSEVADVGGDVVAGRARLEAALGPLGIPYELFPCDPALADTAQFCAAYGFSPDESANTIVVVGKADPRRYATCIVLATHRLDVNRAVRDRLGTRKASFASAEETRELTGMEIGGVTPFGLPGGLPVWIDADVMVRPRIILGGGSRSWKVISTPAILAALPGAEVVGGLANPFEPRAADA
jgi:prolyl-tRNA editing enzyme YbaK/EbsC (Cys-tRNA(Pro) deacylase)